MKTPLILTLSNRKGGTGKTTTAVNLAAEFAALGKSTLLVDLDTQGHGGLGLGVVAKKNDPTVHQLFLGDKNALKACIQGTVHPGLFCAPADPVFSHTHAGDNPQLLAEALSDAAIRERFEVILIDTPPSLDNLLFNALAAARGVIIPLVPHHLAAEGVRQLSRLFYRISTTVNPGLKLFGLVPIMQDPRLLLHRQVISDMQKQYGSARLLRGIRTDIKLAEAFSVQQPVRLYAPKSRGAMDYHLLTQDLLALPGWAPT